MRVCHVCGLQSPLCSPAAAHTPPPSALPSPLRNDGAGRTVTCLYYLISLFQITRTAPFCTTLFFRQFTVKPIRLQVSLSTFWSRRYAPITLITLGCFPSLHQQRIYNYVFVLFRSQSHSESVCKFPRHLTAAWTPSALISLVSFISPRPHHTDFFHHTDDITAAFGVCHFSTNVFLQAVRAREGVIDKMIK